MRDYNKKACEEIDAAVFSGDDFLNGDSRKELREYMAAWERGLKGFDELARELATQQPDKDDYNPIPTTSWKTKPHTMLKKFAREDALLRGLSPQEPDADQHTA